MTEADVVVALIAAANPSWVRDEFLPFVDVLTEVGYDLEPGVYIRTITGVSRNTARLKDVGTSFWRTEVPAIWPRVKSTISQTVHLLRDRGLLSTQLLPSRNSLIPLFVLADHFQGRVPFDRLFRWFLLANADGRYSGASVTTLTQDIATIHHTHDPEAALVELTGNLRFSAAFSAARFHEDYARDRFGRLIVYLLLFDNGAKDWVSKIRIGFTKGNSILSEGFLPEWHHIYPRAVLGKVGRRSGEANVLANITVLNEATNRNQLRAKPPDQYVAQYRVTRDELAQHFAQTPGPVERYDEFVADRAATLAQTANRYFERLDHPGSAPQHKSPTALMPNGHETVDAESKGPVGVASCDDSESGIGGIEASPPSDTNRRLRQHCVRVAETQLGRALTPIGRSTYSSSDRTLTVVCLLSKEHNKPWPACYWFGFHNYHRKALLEAQEGYLALGCGSEIQVLLLPAHVIEQRLPELNITRGPSRMFWHINVLREDGELYLHRKGDRARAQVTEYQILGDRALPQ